MMRHTKMILWKLQFIEDFSNNRKLDPKFQARLKPIFLKTVEFYISIELPKNESNRWPIKFYLKFQNEDYFIPLADFWTYDELFREKFLSILIKKKEVSTHAIGFYENSN